MHSFIKGFGYAFSGIFNTLKSERNIRIHISIASLITAFAYFFGISRAEWAILFLCITSVISAELFNTATERCCDNFGEEYSPFIKLAKNAAAGGVLVTAIGSIIVGICLFGDTKRISETLIYIFTNIKALGICALIFICDCILVFRFRKER